MPEWFKRQHVQCPHCKEWLWIGSTKPCDCKTTVQQIKIRLGKAGELTRIVKT